MKSIYKITGLFVLLTGAMACTKDYIDVEPKGTVEFDQLITPDGVEGLATAAYSGLDLSFAILNSNNATGGTNLYGNTTYLHSPTNWGFGDVRSDDTYKGGGGTADIIELHQFETGNITPENGLLERKWIAMYAAIGRTNEALYALDLISEEEFPAKQTRIAEMRLLRGHFYFEMKKLFRTFPYIDTFITVEEAYEISNDLSEAELWAEIEEDFLYAREHLPESQSQVGRVDRDVAIAYLAKTYLFTEQWDKVMQETGLIIDEYSLLDSYEQQYSVDNEHSPEVIWAIEHSIDDNSAFGQINWGNLLNVPRGPYGGDGFHRPSQNIVNAFRVDANGLPLLDNFNDSNVNENSFVDPRLDHSVGRPGIPWLDLGEYEASWAREANIYGPYAIKKNLLSVNDEHATDGWPWGGSALNWPIIKYSDVVLWRAEAAIMLGDLQTGRELINQIRQRADNSNVVLTEEGEPAANYNVGLYEEFPSQEYALKALRMERRLELAFEGHRFFDLVRWGISGEVINEYFREEQDLRGYLSGAQFLEPRHNYLPIPQRQIDLAGGIYSQDPNY